MDTKQPVIRIAVAGLGKRALWGVEELLNCLDFQIVGLIDLYPELGELFRSQYALADVPVFCSIQECLLKTDFDAVVIFTPDGTHAELAVPALQAGKWVFLDKPIDITETRIRQIIHADKQAGGKTFIGLNLRYAPAMARTCELVRTGKIGQVLTIQQDEFYDGGRTYFRRWNRLQCFSGGLWITKACHDFDLMYWLAGDLPTSVFAQSSLSYYLPKPDAALHCRDCKYNVDCPDRFDQTAYSQGPLGVLYAATEKASGQKLDLCLYNSDKDTFDNGAAMVRFANGVIGTYTVNVVAGFSNRRIRISGTKGTLDVDLAKSEVIFLGRDPARIETVDVPVREGGHGGADSALFPAFARFIRRQPVDFARPQDAAVGVRIGLAAQKSCDEKRLVDMNAVVD
jgi:predicted dehydrogenase